MKTIFSIVLMLFFVFGADIAQSGQKKKEQLRKQQADERKRSLGGQRTGSEGIGAPPIDQNGATNQQQNKDRQNQQGGSSKSSVSDPNEGQSTKADGEANPSATTGQQAQQTEKSNAPAVVQTTSSESGSPAILSPNNGRGRDGTNNVQRSSYNMAGAQVPGNLELSKKNVGERNINTGKRIRKQEEIPSRTNIQGTQRNTLPSTENADRAKENSGGSDKKSKRNERRNKNKNPGK